MSGAAELWAALAIAQSKATRVEKDGRVKLGGRGGYDYASAEAILSAATEAFAATGLALLPLDTRPENGMLLRTYLLTHSSGGTHQLTQAWPIKGQGSDDKVYAGAVTSSLAYMYRDLLAMPRVERGTDSLHDNRPGPGKAERQHHPSFKGGRKAFMAALGERGLSYDKHVAPYCEAQGWGRPSTWPAEQRRQFIADIDAGQLPGLMERANREA